MAKKEPRSPDLPAFCGLCLQLYLPVIGHDCPFPDGFLIARFTGDGRKLAEECLALLRDRPKALQEFCETLGAPVPSPNEED